MPAEPAESGAGSTAPSSAHGSAVNGRPAQAQGQARGISPGVLEAEQVRDMFDRVAVVYDVLNTAMTAGLHHHWRARAADLARVGPGSRVLDVATGTGDLALELARRVAPGGEVIGSDFSEGMLARARAKAGGRTSATGSRESMDAAETGAGDPVDTATGATLGDMCSGAPAELRFEWGDALALPYEDDSFDAATVGFGARNFSDLGRGLAEMARVVRPGGRVVVLEMTTPTKPPLSIFFGIWFDRLVPVLGRLAGSIAATVARLRGATADGTIAAAYTYLPNSVKRFPGPAALASELERAGLSEISYLLTAGGIVAIHAGTVAPKGA
ncbi:MAG: class I SAM-dependent methyltransferase [Solirubrobacteraceae bacterium]|jgi:demethylmenaquinone methyltransferase / 2-methoxy-6-polyprenyl-1,4-benzoquinol methylase